ncbi:serine protease [Stieleria sp. JC731]|uniref:serine protease n=1 Tax=Pirellulaceae TaxID=2691357 RepID=UPI001E32C157|nr:serine protease [Stieleria sp. JC731]MCC9599425.1 serine protease [Stieleria sp. JC731]
MKLLNLRFSLSTTNRQRSATKLAAVLSLTSLIATSGCYQKPGPPNASQRAAEAAQVVDGPDVKANAVWRSYYGLGEKAIEPDKVVSSGFACSFPSGEKNTTYFVTVLHVAEDREQPITEPGDAKRIRQSVRTIGVTEAYGAGDGMKTIGMMAESPGESFSSESSVLFDVALVEPGTVRMKPFKLASSFPDAGSKIYLATAAYGGAPPSQETHEAKILSVDADGAVLYQFSNERLSLQATPGAPLLNAEGEVIGMHIQASDAVESVGGQGVSIIEYWKRYSSAAEASLQ